MYVPRDEAFSEEKNVQFSVKTLQSVLHAAVPAVQSTLIDPNQGFPSFFVIDKLFEDGVALPRAEDLGFLRAAVPRLLPLCNGLCPVLCASGDARVQDYAMETRARERGLRTRPRDAPASTINPSGSSALWGLRLAAAEMRFGAFFKKINQNKCFEVSKCSEKMHIVI